MSRAPARATRCASPTPTARTARSRSTAASRSSRRPGRRTARSSRTSRSSARRRSSSSTTSPPASAGAIADFRGSNSAPAWAPDGERLAVTLSREGGSQLFSIGKNGGEPRRLASSPAIDTEAEYSADGRWLYFTSDRGGSPQIYRMAAAAARPSASPSAAATTSARRSAPTAARSPTSRAPATPFASSFSIWRPRVRNRSRFPTPATTSIRASRRTEGSSSMPPGRKGAPC